MHMSRERLYKLTIEKIFEHNVLYILRTNGTSAQHGKPTLHEEDHGSANEGVELIEIILWTEIEKGKNIVSMSMYF